MLKFCIKMLWLAAFGFAFYFGAFLQEWSTWTSDLADAAHEKGYSLPLTDARIVVKYRAGTLTLYSGDEMIRRYDCGVGESIQANVLSRKAKSTPLGEYEIVAKEERGDVWHRGARFLRISFPNRYDIDRAYEADLIDEDMYTRCVKALRAGEDPPAGLSIGGDIGIQGNYFPFSAQHCTDGSVAISNAAIIELFDAVPLGTPVIIED